MKQHGKYWYTPAGESTLAKYLPEHEKLFERLGQRIATEAVSIEKRQREVKAMFIDLCKEALRNNPDKGAQRRFTFYTFDHEYKIEFDIKEEYVRVYRAIKKNPLSKDYELIVLDFNKSEVINRAEAPIEEEEDENYGLMEIGPDGPRMLSDEEINEAEPEKESPRVHDDLNTLLAEQNTGTLDFDNKNN